MIQLIDNLNPFLSFAEKMELISLSIYLYLSSSLPQRVMLNIYAMLQFIFITTRWTHVFYLSDSQIKVLY